MCQGVQPGELAGKDRNSRGERMRHASVENASLTGNKVIRLPKAVIVVLVWTFIACLSYARYYLRDPHHRLWPDILIWAACFYPWALLTPFIFALEKRFPIG